MSTQFVKNGWKMYGITVHSNQFYVLMVYEYCAIGKFSEIKLPIAQCLCTIRYCGL